MHKKVLSKPVLILLYGFPGSGKTFFARQFKDEINAAHVNSDQLRHEFFENPLYNKQEDNVADHLSYYMVEQFLQTGTSVIYDADSSRIAQRRILYDIAIRAHAEILIVWVQIDIESAFSRVVKRDRRKADDKFSRPLDRTTFESVISKMNNPIIHEDYVVASGKHTFTTQKNNVFKKLFERGLLTNDSVNTNVAKPQLVNRIPNPLAGRVDPSRRNIIIR